MSSPLRSVIQPTGLVHGHSECRDLDETIPVLSHVLALELIDRARRRGRLEASEHRLASDPSRRRPRSSRQA